MYLRTKKRKNKDGTVREYLQIVETRRVNGKVRQKVLCTLGRLDKLQNGQLEAFAESLARFTEKLAVINEAKLRANWSKEYGIVVLVRRLWEELGLPKFLQRALRDSRVEFDVSEAVFAMVLNRIAQPMSKLKVHEWVHEEVYETRFEQLQLHHFYRALDVLAEHKDEIEEDLYFENRDLLNQELDIVFFDTTSTYFEGNADQFRQMGHSKDRRPDCPQIVIGVLMRRDGIPIAHEVFPGSTADINAFKYILKRAKERFRINRVILVADRAVVSKRTLQLIKDMGYEYILGTKMRNAKRIRDEVLSRPGRYKVVNETLRVKNVQIGDERYIVCFNPWEAERDEKTRGEIIRKLQEELSRGKSSLIGNSGYRKYLKVEKDAITIDEAKIRSEARYDGKYVLITNTDMDASEAALAYKELWKVEDAFREMKSGLDMRPIYHWTEKRIRGHVMVCFLAFYLESVFSRKLKEIAPQKSPRDVLHDVCRVKAVSVELNGRKFITRTDLSGDAHLGFKAIGMRPPAEVLQV